MGIIAGAVLPLSAAHAPQQPIPPDCATLAHRLSVAEKKVALLQSQVAELNEAVVQLQRDMATLKQCDESSSSFHQPTPTTGAGFPLHYKIKPMTSVCTRSSPIHDPW